MTSANPMSLPSIRDPLDLLSTAVKRFSMASLEKQPARPLIEAYPEPFLAPLINKVKSKPGEDMPFWQGNLWFLIPMFLFRRLFERHFIKGVTIEAEINLSRLANQWERSVNNAIDAMRIQATSYVHEELATMEAYFPGRKGGRMT